jgi:UDP-4-amino-4,6-dideoxy-L-N-acetyl-beta-L-altrosamine transaminase
MDDAAFIVDSSHTVNPTMSCDFIFFSFHPVKPIAMGNGGVAATDDKAAAEFFRRFRNFGRVPLGISYDVVQTGFNFYMNDLNAAIGLGQLDVYKENMERRKAIAEIYNKIIDREKYDIVRHTDARGESSYYLYTVVTKHSKNVAGLMSFLRAKEIEAIIHYPLIHKLSFFSKQMPRSNLRNSEQVENRFINIPCHAAMEARDAEFVAVRLNEYADGV